jgi:hypothetical protein
MRSAVRSPWPQRTTVVAGALLLICGVLLLLESARASLPVTEVHVIPLSGPVVALAAALTRAAAFLIAALGIAGEVGIVAGSTVGRVALVVWGAADLAWFLLDLVPSSDVAPDPVLGTVQFLLQLGFAAAGLVAAILIIRTRVLSGVARWVLLPVALVDCAFIALASPPPFAIHAALSVMVALDAVPSEYLPSLLTLLVAVSLLLWGRTEAVKHRAKVIHDAW